MLPLPAGKEATAGAGALGYERGRPEYTLLYQLVEEYYPAFEAELVAQGTELPLTRSLRGYHGILIPPGSLLSLASPAHVLPELATHDPTRRQSPA
jgi:hypothetical protein